jgi:hypothetical protein
VSAKAATFARSATAKGLIVDEDTGGPPEDEHRVLPVDRVGKQDHAANDAEVPEGDRDDRLPAALGGDPLDQEAPEKARLLEEADRQPRLRRVHAATSRVRKTVRGVSEPPPDRR